MTEAEKHAKGRLAEAVKYVSRQWGGGWNRLSDGQQEAFVRAELFAEINRISIPGVDPATYKEMVSAIVEAGVQWQGGIR